MEFKDYYKTLGVDKKDDIEKIKSAYRDLAKKYHPDTSKEANAEERFKEISEAYEVLRSPEKRAKYDRLGSSYNNFRNTGGSGTDFNWQDWFSKQGETRRQGKKKSFGEIFDSGDLSDFFKNIFGGVSSGFSQKTGFNYPPKRGDNVEIEVELSIKESYTGVTKLMQVNEDKIEVKFKPGINDGQILKIPDKGSQGKHGGTKGDLLIKVKITENPRIERKNDDLYVEVTIDLYKAILGGSATITSFGGKLKIEIPPESQPGKTLKLNGQGLPNYNNPEQKGDLYIKLQVKLPTKLNDREKELFKMLQEIRK